MFLGISGNLLHAQFFESGTEPATLRWKQIHTEHFRIIFPADAAGPGQQAANTLEFIYKAGGKSLNHLPKKIPVVLHNRPSISNGFVSWAPKRAEWYLTPPQSNYAHNWADQLALHEYRHVVQIDKLNQGFTKALGIITGQQGIGLISGLVPKWFLEGDAVAAETALTHAGRGRSPSFEMPLRTIALSGDCYPYEKALFGSYRDHVPNHYELGYQMVAWTRNRYGYELYDKAINTVARKPYLFFMYPFKLGMKEVTGYTTRQMYSLAFDDLTTRWKQQEETMGYDSYSAINRRNTDVYTSYRFPQYLDDSACIAYKSSMEDISRWVKIDRSGNEYVLHTPGTVNSEKISYAAGKLVWTETIQDIRWSNRSYSVVKILDVRTGKTRILQPRTRFFSPSLSPDGKTIAVVEVNLQNECYIVLSDAVTGIANARIPGPEGALLQTPSWSRDGAYLVMIVNGGKGKSIMKLDPVSEQFSTILPPTYDHISHPVDAGKHILFTGHYNGINNIYAVDYRTGEIYQVTSSRFGAFDPQPDASANRMVYSEYSVKGYDLVEMQLDESRWLPVNTAADHSLKLYRALAGEENFNLQDSIIPQLPHDTKPFRKWAHWFNVHSWAPLYYQVNTSDVMSTEIYPGLVLLSQDLLGNMTSSAGYSWRGYHALHANFTYKGLYPVIELNIDYGGDRSVIGRPESGPVSVHPQGESTEIGVRAYIPFTLTRNRYITSITPQINASYENSYFYAVGDGNYKQGIYEQRYTLYAYRYLKTSERDFTPRLGVALQASLNHTPTHTQQFGHIYYVYGRLYLPGIGKHHSLQLAGGWQQQKTKEYLFGTLLNFPRGYDKGRTEKLITGTIEYAFPLIYPDWHLSRLAYIKRLRANVFCDVAENSYRVSAGTTTGWLSENMLGTGIDLIADINVLQIYFPISLGIRTVFVPETKKVYPSALFNITFN